MNHHESAHSYSNLEAVSLIHQVAAFYMSTKFPRDYGTGAKYTSLEVHTLQDISVLPDVTVTDLSIRYGKTKGAISQIIKKLESKDLLRRVPSGNNDNRFFLELTEKGHALDAAHRQYDTIHAGETMERVRSRVTAEEFDTAFRVLEVWLQARREVHQERINAAKEQS